jgi:hypothetical protein
MTGRVGALLLAQSARERVFEALRESPSIGGWDIAEVAGEPETLVGRRDGVSVAIVCGRQVRAADGLEVLALGTCSSFQDGRAFRATLDDVVSSGAVAVVPWGLGTWVGQRGVQVTEGLRDSKPGVVFVGDNGSRLDLLGMPALVRRLEQDGLRVLPGTDPFPIAADHCRVGRFGFLADIAPDEAAPWRSLRAWLRALTASPRGYGAACDPVRFLRIQGGIQVHNRLLRGRAA